MSPLDKAGVIGIATRLPMTGSILKLNVFTALQLMLFPMAIITVCWKDRGQIGLPLANPC
jgi:hypothetical protein